MQSTSRRPATTWSPDSAAPTWRIWPATSSTSSRGWRPGDHAPMTTMTCRICDVVVPAADFCGHCGATAARRRGDGRSALRLSAYAAAGGHVLRPALTSTIFPALPRRSRPAFTVAFLGVVALMVGVAVPLWEAALIGLVGVGLPLLFLAYLWE